MLEAFSSIASQNIWLPLTLIVAGTLCIGLKFIVATYTTTKRKTRSKRAYGKIVSYKKRINTDIADDYLPVIEFAFSDKSYTITSLYAQAEPVPPKFAKSGKVLVAFDPHNPEDADMDNPELRRQTALAQSILLFAGFTLLLIGSLGLYF
ncbi:MAG: DUF3592 domain-containing protein [Deltaproteobacteria bacterium]|nr:DUF3592 domain-containing protein [Deltaproteobacteria bacterium]